MMKNERMGKRQKSRQEFYLMRQRERERNQQKERYIKREAGRQGGKKDRGS